MNAHVELMQATSQLLSCLEQELDIIRHFDCASLAQKQAEKALLGAKLSANYKAWTQALRQRADAIRSDPQLLSEFEEKIGHCQAAIAENIRSLKAMRQVSEKVLASIVTAIEESRTRVARYDRRGKTLKERTPDHKAHA